MLTGSVPIDPHKKLNEVEEEKCAVFSFPEYLSEEGRVDDSKTVMPWSATAPAALMSFLEAEGVAVMRSSSQTGLRLSQASAFHVHGDPEPLR